MLHVYFFLFFRQNVKDYHQKQTLKHSVTVGFVKMC